MQKTYNVGFNGKSILASITTNCMFMSRSFSMLLYRSLNESNFQREPKSLIIHYDFIGDKQPVMSDTYYVIFM